MNLFLKIVLKLFILEALVLFLNTILKGRSQLQKASRKVDETPLRMTSTPKQIDRRITRYAINLVFTRPVIFLTH